MGLSGRASLHQLASMSLP